MLSEDSIKLGYRKTILAILEFIGKVSLVVIPVGESFLEANKS
jgi:hypothetical protein